MIPNHISFYEVHVQMHLQGQKKRELARISLHKRLDLIRSALIARVTFC